MTILQSQSRGLENCSMTNLHADGEDNYSRNTDVCLRFIYRILLVLNKIHALYNANPMENGSLFIDACIAPYGTENDVKVGLKEECLFPTDLYANR